MNLVKLLNNPMFNALFGGILLYFVIIISNKGNPTLGALLSSFPIGILGLLAINKKNQENFIISAVFVNLIIFIMWVIVWTICRYFSKNLYLLCIIGFLSWAILCMLYYYITIKKNI